MTEQTKPEVNPVIRGMADIFKPMITTPEGGKATIPAEAFEQVLPEGKTMKMFIEDQTLQNNIYSALDLAFGEVGVPYLAQTPDVDSLYMKTKVGNATYAASLDRSRSVPAGVGAGAGRKDVYGHLTSGVTPAGRSDKKAVMASIHNLGLSMLANG